MSSFRDLLYKTLKAGLFAFLVILSPSANSQEYDLPIRVIARADVNRMQYHRYSILEFLEIYNDDYSRSLWVDKITANSWIGHKKHILNEIWMDGRRRLEVPPGSVRRVVQRKRIVSGYYKRDWWIRWIRFTVNTDRGRFISNFVSSPFKPPGKLETNLKQRYIDSISEPGEITIRQKIEQKKGK